MSETGNNLSTVCKASLAFNSNSEVAGGGGADEARPTCARSRAQQPASFEPRNIYQPPARPTWLRRRDDRTPPMQKFNLG